MRSNAATFSSLCMEPGEAYVNVYDEMTMAVRNKSKLELVLRNWGRVTLKDVLCLPEECNIALIVQCLDAGCSITEDRYGISSATVGRVHLPQAYAHNPQYASSY